MNRIFKVFCFTTIFLVFIVGISFSQQNQSSSKEFNVTEKVKLNLNNSFTENVSVINNENYNISLTFDNSSAVQFLYGPNSSLFLLVINNTGDYSNENFLKNNSEANFTVKAYCNQTCYPGKYKGKFTIFNSTNSSENASVEVEIDWPIFVNENGTANFSGIFPYNSTTYHSFYFNTSNITKASSLAIVLLEGLDLDVFLLDEGENLKAKSINTEEFCYGNNCFALKLLSYKSLPENEVWEIRIANSTEETEYGGFLTLSGLKVSEESIDFEGLNSTQNHKSSMIELINEGERPIEVSEILKNFYYLKSFEGASPNNFSFLVPNKEIINKIKASLVWNGNSNYSLAVYDPSENFIEESSEKSTSAKVCDVEREEFVEVPKDLIKPGYWKISVLNSTPSDDIYTLTIFLYYNSTWVSTNFSRTILNQTNFTDINVSLRLGKISLDGYYGGLISYIHNDYGKGLVQIPFYAFVNTSMLVINETFISSQIELIENTDFNLTKTLSIKIENPGSYELNLNESHSDTLKNTNNQTKTISLEVDPPSSIPPKSFGLLNLTLNINTLNTSNALGLYEGWVYLNSSEAQPYSYFNLTIKVNLTNELKLKIYDLKTVDGDKEIENPSLSENITLVFNVTLANGTSFESLIKDNFITLLNHKNVSYSLGPYNVINASNEIFDENYKVNFTLPSKKPGGYYNVTLKATYRGLRGNDTFNYLLINNTALRMSIPSTEFSVNNGSSFLINVSIDNFGPLSATNAKIKIILGNCLASASFHSGKCEGVSLSGGSEVAFNLSSNKVNSCYVAWNVVASTPTETTAFCDSSIEGINATFFWNLTFSTTVTKQVGGGGGGGGELPYYFYNLTFIKAENLIFVKQNSTNSTLVTVKNTGNASQEITFSILNINSSWYRINSTNATLAPNKQASFLIDFSVGFAEAKDYSGRFKASSPNKTVIFDFTLRVLPLVILNESQIREINDTLTLYKIEMINFSLQINTSREQGYNVSSAEEILLEVKKKIEEAENYISRGNYSAAQQLLPTIKTLLNQVEEELEKIKPKGGLDWSLIAIIISTIVGVTVLLYLFWPTKTGYIVEKKKYVHKPKNEKIRKELKEKWEKVSKKNK